MKQAPTNPLPGLALYVLVAAPVSLLVLLVWSGFFWGASGWVAAHRPFEDDLPMTAVVVEDDAGGAWDLLLPTPVVKRLAVPELRSGFLTPRKPDAPPTLHKDRFALELSLVHSDGQPQQVATTSPYALAAAVLVFVVGFFVRNMIVSGSPIALTRSDRALTLQQAPAGQPAAPRKSGRSKQGPPSRTRRRKKKRKR